MQIPEENKSELLVVSKTYTRIIEDSNYVEYKPPILDSIPREIYSQIDWKKDGDTNITEVPTPAGVKYLVYSQPVRYSIDDKRPLFIDLCIESDNKDIALELFKQKKEESERIKRERKELLEPYLLSISQIPEIVFLAGRGSIFDPRRIATIRDDCDISIFTDCSSKEGLKSLLEVLNYEYSKIAQELNIKVSMINFQREKDSVDSYGEDIVEKTNAIFELSTDLIDYRQSYNTDFVGNLKENDPYVVDTFSNYTFLGGDKEKFNRIKTLFQ